MTTTVRAGSRRREAALALVGVVCFLALVLRYPGAAATAAITGGATGALAGWVGTRWLRSARLAAGRLRVGLRLLGVGFIGWAAGQLLWLTGVPVARTASTPVFDAAALLIAAGVAWMAASRRLGSVRVALDGLIMAAGLFFVSWAVVLGPVYRASGGGLAGFSAAAYPIIDVLIGSITLLMLYEARGLRRRPLAIAGLGLLVVLTADTGYAWQFYAGTYTPGRLLDLGWFAGFAIVGIGAPRAAEIGGSTAMVEGGRPWDFLPYVPFGAALGTGVAVFVLRHGRVDPALYLLTLLLTVLILVRQLLSLRDNRSLNRRLTAAVEDLRHRAYHDALTGLANRAMLLDQVERRLEAGELAALLYVDLDGFKPVNDTYGHDAGDRVLVEVAARLCGCVRADDLVARLGGDEFALLLAGSPAARRDAAAVAERVIGAVGVPIAVRTGEVVVTASVGIALPAGATGVGDLVRNADLAMYTAKLRGRNRAVRFGPDLVPAGRP